MIYAFIGLKGSGKTTACNYLKTKLEGVHHVNFKDNLVRELKETMHPVLMELGIIYGMTIDELFAHKPPAMRALMQSFGTEVRRAQNKNYWVDQWVRDVSQVAELHEGQIVNTIVTDDCRFISEYEAIKSLGGITIRLNRADLVNTDEHQSETEQASLQADYTIECEKDNLEKLYTALDDILRWSV
jgi:dephospho-CoA kinase